MGLRARQGDFRIVKAGSGTRMAAANQSYDNAWAVCGFCVSGSIRVQVG